MINPADMQIQDPANNLTFKMYMDPTKFQYRIYNVNTLFQCDSPKLENELTLTATKFQLSTFKVSFLQLTLCLIQPQI